MDDAREIFDLDHQPSGVAFARAFAAGCLNRWGVSIDADLALLLVSEAVTNAVQHGAPPAQLELRWDGATLHVNVEDAANHLVPTLPSRPPPGAEGGRGLLLIDRLADRWGVDLRPESKGFWFELGHPFDV